MCASILEVSSVRCLLIRPIKLGTYPTWSEIVTPTVRDSRLGVFSMSLEQLNGVSETAFPLEELSWTITKNASIVSQFLGANHIPQPSLNHDGPSTVVPGGSPQSIHEARQNLIAASLEILQLAIGPSEFLPNLATGVRLERSSLQPHDKTYS